MPSEASSGIPPLNNVLGSSNNVSSRVLPIVPFAIPSTLYPAITPGDVLGSLYDIHNKFPSVEVLFEIVGGMHFRDSSRTASGIP